MSDLANALLAVETPAEMDAFLSALLSLSELSKFQRRLDLFRRARAGQSHRSIAADLGVGIGTVSRAAAAMRQHAAILQTVLNRVEQDDGGNDRERSH